MDPVDLIPEFEENRLVEGTPPGGWGPCRKRLEIVRRFATGPVVDLGAGTGWVAMHLRRWGYEVTAVDLSETMRAVFERNMTIVGESIPCVHADATSLPFPDSSFGTVVSFSMLEHVPDLDGVLAEIDRILVPDGFAVVGVPNAFGSYSLLADHDPRAFFRRREVQHIESDHEHLHGPRWWRRTLARRLDVVDLVKLELLTPLLAVLFGYERPAALTRADVRVADWAPAAVSSDLVYVLRPKVRSDRNERR